MRGFIKNKIEIRRKVLVTENNSCKDPSHAWYDFKSRVSKFMVTTKIKDYGISNIKVLKA